MISIDIGMSKLSILGLPPGTPRCDQLLPYQQVNVAAFLTQNDTLMRRNVVGTPCANCTAITSNTGWPYFQFCRNTTGDPWPERVRPSVPRHEWKLSFVPSFPPSVPILFLYGTCDIGTGCVGCPPCAPRTMFFFDKSWTDWLAARGDGTKAQSIGGCGHWCACRQSAATNGAIADWLASFGA